MAAAILTPFITRTAVRVDILDRPGGRKLHATAVPRLGGVAVALGLAVALGVSIMADAHQRLGRAPPLADVLPIIAGAVLVFAVGLWDDVDPRPPTFKLAVELAAVPSSSAQASPCPTSRCSGPRTSSGGWGRW